MAVGELEMHERHIRNVAVLLCVLANPVMFVALTDLELLDLLIDRILPCLGRLHMRL